LILYIVYWIVDMGDGIFDNVYYILEIGDYILNIGY